MHVHASALLPDKSLNFPLRAATKSEYFASPFPAHTLLASSDVIRAFIFATVDRVVGSCCARQVDISTRRLNDSSIHVKSDKIFTLNSMSNVCSVTSLHSTNSSCNCSPCTGLGGVKSTQSAIIISCYVYIVACHITMDHFVLHAVPCGRMLDAVSLACNIAKDSKGASSKDDMGRDTFMIENACCIEICTTRGYFFRLAFF